jgi:drug/metabolite transporter (DMT)-like permease
MHAGLHMGGSATKAAFLSQAGVVLTPLLDLARSEPAPCAAWLSALVALGGVALISFDQPGAAAKISAMIKPSTTGTGTETADILFLGAGLANALLCLRQGDFSQDPILARKIVPVQALKNWLLFTATAVWLCVDVLASPPAHAQPDLVGGALGQGQALSPPTPWGGVETDLLAEWPGAGKLDGWLILLLSAIGAGVFAELLQGLGQRTISATHANVLLAMEPLWAALLSWLWLGEQLGWHVWVGGLLLILAGMCCSMPGSGSCAKPRGSQEQRRPGGHTSHGLCSCADCRGMRLPSRHDERCAELM